MSDPALVEISLTSDVRQSDKGVAGETTEKKAMGEQSQSTRKLVVCAAGIFICYFYYGILQEKM